MNYEKLLCQRVAQVPPSGIRKFFDIANTMQGVISLGVGEPDFKTPWVATDAAIYSLRSGHTHYTSNWGLLELRKLIARYQAERFGPEYNPENEILVTVGASEGIDLAVRALVEPGDDVLVPDPSYVSYMPCITFAGGNCVPVKTEMSTGFKITPEVLKQAITPRTKALILPYPNNPTGGVMSRSDYQGIADVLKDTDIFVIHDEIYAELTYGGERHRELRGNTRHVGAHHHAERLLQGLCYDRLAPGLRLRPSRGHAADVPHPPVHDALRADSQPVCRHRGAEDRLRH